MGLSYRHHGTLVRFHTLSMLLSTARGSVLTPAVNVANTPVPSRLLHVQKRFTGHWLKEAVETGEAKAGVAANSDPASTAPAMRAAAPRAIMSSGQQIFSEVTRLRSSGLMFPCSFGYT